MPTYDYHCDACDEDFVKRLPMSQYQDPQECPNCGKSPARKMVSAGAGFILKGDGWTGKNHMVSRQMAQKNRKLTAKQEEIKRDAPSVTLVPNVGGERTESWAEASKLAQSRGKDTSGYEKRAAKEKKA